MAIHPFEIVRLRAKTLSLSLLLLFSILPTAFAVTLLESAGYGGRLPGGGTLLGNIGVRFEIDGAAALPGERSYFYRNNIGAWIDGANSPGEFRVVVEGDLLQDNTAFITDVSGHFWIARDEIIFSTGVNRSKAAASIVKLDSAGDLPGGFYGNEFDGKRIATHVFEGNNSSNYSQMRSWNPSVTLASGHYAVIYSGVAYRSGIHWNDIELDLEGDDFCNLGDLVRLKRHILGLISLSSSEQARLDLSPSDGDGILSLADAIVCERKLLGID